MSSYHQLEICFGGSSVILMGILSNAVVTIFFLYFCGFFRRSINDPFNALTSCLTLI